MHLIHRWYYIDVARSDTFCDKPVYDKYRKFRQCKVCGKTQQFNWDSQGGCWSTLDAQRTEIFNSVYCNLLPNAGLHRASEAQHNEKG